MLCLMIRMLVIGYCYGIRSERRLCEEVRLNLAYRWFCRLGLEEAIPDHSAFSRARHGRFRDADILRSVFESTVKTCMDKGLVGGEGFATDASIIRADANRQNHIDGCDDHDWTGGAGSGGSGPSRAVSEYLKGLDREAAPPKEISLSDPASRLTAAVGRPAFFGWCTNYLIDVKHAVIMDVVATAEGMRLISTILFVVLMAIAALHAYWGVGGLWPAASERELIDTVIGSPGFVRMPPAWMTFTVVALLLMRRCM